MRLIRFLFALLFLAAIGLLTLGAIFGLLGYAHPALDAFNHLQPLLFGGTLIGIFAAPLFLGSPRSRAFGVTLAATGFMSSAVMVAPEVAWIFVPHIAKPDDIRPIYTLLNFNISRENFRGDLIARLIAREQPDIITLQEYLPDQHSGLHLMFSVDYPFHTICTGDRRANIAIYSKLQFAAEGQGACASSSDGTGTARIVATFKARQGKVFTLVTTHLDWPAEFTPPEPGEDLRTWFDEAFLKQKREFDDLGRALTRLPGPLVLAGDLNATPWSYGMRDFEDYTGLIRQTRGLPTYPVRIHLNQWYRSLPFLPIDHVMARGGIEIHEVYASDPSGSDHLPVVAKFSLGVDRTNL
jgi:endonuclease/exonuclease/phosphatase (EEP) superfamily protein YafD